MELRADFNFSDKENKIACCKGFILGEGTPDGEDFIFAPDVNKIKYENLICNGRPNFNKLAELVLKNCVLQVRG